METKQCMGFCLWFVLTDRRNNDAIWLWPFWFYTNVTVWLWNCLKTGHQLLQHCNCNAITLFAHFVHTSHFEIILPHEHVILFPCNFYHNFWPVKHWTVKYILRIEVCRNWQNSYCSSKQIVFRYFRRAVLIMMMFSESHTFWWFYKYSLKSNWRRFYSVLKHKGQSTKILQLVFSLKKHLN